jgi:hypothetical protein
MEENNMKSKHTPTPWKEDHQGGLYIEGKNGEYIAEVESEGGREEQFANAAFIVRACNAHDALVEALQELQSNCRGINEVLSEGGDINQAIFIASRTIVKAEAALKLAEEGR